MNAQNILNGMLCRVREMGDVLMCHNKNYEIACVGKAIKKLFWSVLSALDCEIFDIFFINQWTF